MKIDVELLTHGGISLHWIRRLWARFDRTSLTFSPPDDEDVTNNIKKSSNKKKTQFVYLRFSLAFPPKNLHFLCSSVSPHFRLELGYSIGEFAALL